MGATPYQPSVEELRIKSERNRTKLTETVDQLSGAVSSTVSEVKQRLSPTQIKQDLRDYVRGSGEQVLETLQRKINENPLQAAAIGVGLAIPLMRLLKNMPAPMLLVGAGLLLSKSQVREKVTKMSQDAMDTVSHIGNRASDASEALGERVARAASDLKNDAADLGVTAVTAADSVKSVILATARSAKDSVSNVSGDVAEAIHRKSDSAIETAAQNLASAKTAVADAGDRSIEAATDFVQQHPVLVGGIGLAIGALIAGSLPRSQTEDRLLGQASEGIKNQARNVVSASVDAAKEVAVGVASDVAASAAREGLDASGLKGAVANFGESVRSVANAGLNAATGNPAVASFQKHSSTQ